jgi:hypothetical protein
MSGNASAGRNAAQVNFEEQDNITRRIVALRVFPSPMLGSIQIW